MLKSFCDRCGDEIAWLASDGRQGDAIGLRRDVNARGNWKDLCPACVAAFQAWIKPVNAKSESEARDGG